MSKFGEQIDDIILEHAECAYMNVVRWRNTPVFIIEDGDS